MVNIRQLQLLVNIRKKTAVTIVKNTNIISDLSHNMNTTFCIGTERWHWWGVKWSKMDVITRAEQLQVTTLNISFRTDYVDIFNLDLSTTTSPPGPQWWRQVGVLEIYDAAAKLP